MKAKKVMALALAAVLLVCASVAATVAYLTDTESVNNTFTVGQIHISMDEAKVDVYGVKQLDANREEIRVTDGNAYKLIPGHTYVKDPTVTVDANSENSYIRMVVKVKDADMAKLKLAFPKAKYADWYAGEVFLLQKLVNWNEAKWPSQGAPSTVTESDVTYTVYEFRYHQTVNTLDTNTADSEPAQPLTLESLFTEFTVPYTVEATELNNLDGVAVKIEAHAIQADGFANADAAWAAFTA